MLEVSHLCFKISFLCLMVFDDLINLLFLIHLELKDFLLPIFHCRLFLVQQRIKLVIVILDFTLMFPIHLL